MAKKQLTISYEESTYQTVANPGFKELIDATILFSKMPMPPTPTFGSARG
jgi:hypothetical protein